MAETKAIPFEEKVFEKNKTTNEKVVPKSTGLKGKNSELQAGETHMLHCISRWTGEMPDIQVLSWVISLLFCLKRLRNAKRKRKCSALNIQKYIPECKTRE